MIFHGIFSFLSKQILFIYKNEVNPVIMLIDQNQHKETSYAVYSLSSFHSTASLHI